VAKFITAENAEVWWVPSISNTSAPTVTELNAGTRLSSFIRGGFQADFSSNLVDAAVITSAFNSTVAGTYGGGTNTITGLLYDDTTNTAWNTLPRGTAGYFVVSLAGTANQSGASWATGNVATGVFPAEVVSRTFPDLTRDALVEFNVEYAITSAPVYGATAA
jgi:hypothetical protein